ncbi:trypsin-like peptidase domain-containing protein [Streptomyces sp. NEAU-S7GS2]|uniref:trypsin-like peptidase domain-containing protein n=1 Tax=Streptomyces sp. NEAU-S7GS2 TaxID=2202000 RepID=UPI0013A5962D|nr:trypsin-like peptidase domain-containing protein [Streptomyces sp. NEAU-S7GS2]
MLPWQVRICPAVKAAGGTGRTEGPVAGGGVWVGERWVLTCGHVVSGLEAPVMVRFSFTDQPAIPAQVVQLCRNGEDERDLALLQLEGPAPKKAQPAPLRPARATVGHRCITYGYPKGHDDGVRSAPWIEGATGQNLLQLTTQVAHGHQLQKGFSGSGLFDTEIKAVVGLVVTRDKTPGVLGGFAIPVEQAARAFPQLRPWVGWQLSTDPHLRAHWRPRARGVARETTPGWYFTGRTRLLRELTAWIENENPGGGLRVVTGPAGTGKSAVLAWLTALADPQLRTQIARARPDALADLDTVPAPGRISAAVWARSLDDSGATRALAAALAVPVPAEASVEDVREALREYCAEESDGLVVVVDALDEAAEPRRIARNLLVPLAEDLGGKVLVGTRPGRGDGLLTALGAEQIYRLNQDPWFTRQDLVNYSTACLRLDFAPQHRSAYRNHPEVCAAVAAAIADAATSNFLVAGLTARSRATQLPIDTSQPGWAARQRFPADVGQAFEDYLERYGEHTRRARDLLRALAYAEGPGLPADALWPRLAGALAAAPRRYDLEDVAWLLEQAADYLIETDPTDTEPAYRLFHRALVDHLRSEQDEARAQQRLTAALRADVPSGSGGAPDWARAHPYARRHLAVHAARAGRLDELVTDPAFLVHAEPTTLLHALPEPSDSEPAAIRAYRHAAWLLHGRSPQQRGLHLRMAALRLPAPDLAADLARLPLWTKAAWEPLWSHRTANTQSQIIGSHGAGVTSLTVLCRDGRPVMASLGENGTLRLWDLRTSIALTETIPVGQPGGYGMIACELAEQTVLLIRTGRTIELLDGQSLENLATLPSPENLAITACTVGRIGDQTVVVTGYSDGSLYLSDPTDWPESGPGSPAHNGPVLGLGWSLGTKPQVVSTGADGVLLIWSVSDEGLGVAGSFTHPDGCWLGPVASTEEADHVWAVGAADGLVTEFHETADKWTVKMVDVHQPSGCLARYVRPDGKPYDLHLLGLEHYTYDALLQFGQEDRELDNQRIREEYEPGSDEAARARHDMEERQAAPLVALRGGVNTVAILADEGRRLVASGGEDGAIMLITGPPGQLRLVAQTGRPVGGAVLLHRLDDRAILVAAEAEGTGLIRAWRLHGGEDPLPSVPGSVNADTVALAALPAAKAIAVANARKQVMLIDAATGRQAGPKLDCRQLAPRALAAGPIPSGLLAVVGRNTASGCGEIQIWEAGSGRPLHIQIIPELSEAVSVTALSDNTFAFVGPLTEEANDAADVWLIQRSGEHWHAIPAPWDTETHAEEPEETWLPPMIKRPEQPDLSDDLSVVIRRANRPDQPGDLSFVTRGARCTELILGDNASDLWILDLSSRRLRQFGAPLSPEAPVASIVHRGRPALFGSHPGGGTLLTFLDEEGGNLEPPQEWGSEWGRASPAVPTTLGATGDGRLYAATTDGSLLVWDDANTLPNVLELGALARYSVSVGNVLVLATHEELIALAFHDRDYESFG